MASGDTKTEAMLNALGNGGSADEFRGCCNTKTQQYILDAIDRVQNVEDEVEELKNNPDVVDIVDTYADLQAYDTTHLSDNDIIRVLADETHSGNSTYYKFNKQAGTWTFIGEISGGGIKTLTTADYNYPVNNPTRIALWRLPEGIYTLQSSISVYAGDNFVLDYMMNKGDITTVTNDPVSSNKTVYITHCNGTKGLIYKTSDGNSAQVWNPPTNVIDNLINTNVNYALSAKQGNVLNEKIGDLSALTTTVKTSAVAAINELAQGGGGIVTTLSSSNYNWDSTGQGGTPDAIAAWLLNSGWYTFDPSFGDGAYITVDQLLDGEGVLFYVNNQSTQSTIFGILVGNGVCEWVVVDNSDGSIIDGDTQAGYLMPYQFNFVDDVNRLQHQCPIIRDTSPEPTDAGALGQLWTDTDSMNTYQCTAIDDSDPSNIQYTWTLKF